MVTRGPRFVVRAAGVAAALLVLAYSSTCRAYDWQPRFELVDVQLHDTSIGSGLTVFGDNLKPLSAAGLSFGVGFTNSHFDLGLEGSAHFSSLSGITDGTTASQMNLMILGAGLRAGFKVSLDRWALRDVVPYVDGLLGYSVAQYSFGDTTGSAGGVAYGFSTGFRINVKRFQLDLGFVFRKASAYQTGGISMGLVYRSGD